VALLKAENICLIMAMNSSTILGIQVIIYKQREKWTLSLD